jgi:hypothetical protein
MRSQLVAAFDQFIDVRQATPKLRGSYLNSTSILASTSRAARRTAPAHPRIAQRIGLPELVTSHMADYEALALTLARDAARLRDIRAKLARNRDIDPLFDTGGVSRGIEAADAKMWEIWQTEEIDAKRKGAGPV